VNAITRFLGLDSEASATAPTSTPHEDARKAKADHLKGLRADAAAIAARARPFDRAAAITAPAAHADLAELERQHTDAEAAHALAGTLDHDRPDRVAGIERARKRLNEAEHAARIGKSAMAQNEAALRPLLAEIAAAERELPLLERAALLERLDAAAVEHQHAHAAYLASTYRVFALAHAATARGAVVGAGLEAHLILPHPERPAFKDCEIPRGYRLDIAAEAERILRELRA